MEGNKEVLKYCPNYYDIVNFNFNEEDMISDKIVGIYKNYIFSINTHNTEEVSKVKELDRVLGSYLKDYLFRSTLQKEIISVKVKKDNNLIRNFVDAILKIFVNYEEYTTRKLYISKWI